MWCMKCNNHVATCVCLDINTRLAKANENPNVHIEMCQYCGEHHARCKCLKVGKLAVIHEDGLTDLVEIIADNSGRGKKDYDLKHVRHLNHSGCGIETGGNFHVMQRTDRGAWGGMWSLEPYSSVTKPER